VRAIFIVSYLTDDATSWVQNGWGKWGSTMPEQPKENNSPFSLPFDVPEVVPIDYPELDSNVDPHEAYDEGLDDVIDVNPYRFDDDPIKSAKKLMKLGATGKQYYTTDHFIIQDWAEYRYGHPARIKNFEDVFYHGGLVVHFEDDEPDLDIEDISWEEFFHIFDDNNMVFMFSRNKPSGNLSYFYRLVPADNIALISEAKLKN